MSSGVWQSIDCSGYLVNFLLGVFIFLWQEKLKKLDALDLLLGQWMNCDVKLNLNWNLKVYQGFEKKPQPFEREFLFEFFLSHCQNKKSLRRIFLVLKAILELKKKQPSRRTTLSGLLSRRSSSYIKSAFHPHFLFFSVCYSWV